MSVVTDPTVAVVVAAAAHLAFQATVTVVVYPALAEARTTRWSLAHAGHMRRIGWLVAPVYLAMAGAYGVAIATECCSPPLTVSAVAAASAVLISVAVAAPTHVRMDRDGPTDALTRRLLIADRVRFGAAVVAFVAALGVL